VIAVYDWNCGDRRQQTAGSSVTVTAPKSHGDVSPLVKGHRLSMWSAQVGPLPFMFSFVELFHRHFPVVGKKTFQCGQNSSKVNV